MVGSNLSCSAKHSFCYLLVKAIILANYLLIIVYLFTCKYVDSRLVLLIFSILFSSELPDDV